MMKLVAAFTRLHPVQRRVLLAALFDLLYFSIALGLKRHNAVAHQMKNANQITRPPTSDEFADVEWAVTAVSKRIFKNATCLLKCLAVKRGLERLGAKTTLHIGQRRDADGGFHFHSWVTADSGLSFLADHQDGHFRKLRGPDAIA